LPPLLIVRVDVSPVVRGEGVAAVLGGVLDHAGDAVLRGVVQAETVAKLVADQVSALRIAQVEVEFALVTVAVGQGDRAVPVPGVVGVGPDR
jgi:hypothetical protein